MRFSLLLGRTVETRGCGGSASRTGHAEEQCVKANAHLRCDQRLRSSLENCSRNGDASSRDACFRWCHCLSLCPSLESPLCGTVVLVLVCELSRGVAPSELLTDLVSPGFRPTVGYLDGECLQ